MALLSVLCSAVLLWAVVVPAFGGESAVISIEMVSFVKKKKVKQGL